MRQNRKNWTPEEDQTIAHLVKKFGTKRWTLISEKMKERFPDEGRSGKQCRQRWHNHLSPIINKDPWSEEQIKLVFDSHRRFGNKWTEIAQLLEGRTDNAVKNQFYSTMRKGLRRICKILGSRNSTTKIKKVKPTVLSSLISNFTEFQIQQGQNQQELYDMLFEFSNGDKYQELKEKEVHEKYKQKMERLLEKIIDTRESGKRKRNKNIIKQHNNKQINRNQKAHNEKKQQKVSQKQEEEDFNKFDFNIELENENEYRNRNNNQHSNGMQLFHYDEFDQRLENPISLKKQNSLAQSIKSEDLNHRLKKKNSEHEKYHRKNNQFQILNNENYLKCFLSKSPNFSSRSKLPTPCVNEYPHYLIFNSNPNGQELIMEQPEKELNLYAEELKKKIERKQRQRLR